MIPKPDQGHAGSGPQPQVLLSQTQKTWHIMNPRKLGKLLCKKGNTRLGCHRKYTLGVLLCLPVSSLASTRKHRSGIRRPARLPIRIYCPGNLFKVAAGLGKLPLFCLQRLAIRLCQPLEQFLPVDIIRWEISDETLGLSDSQKGPLRAETSLCHTCSEHTLNKRQTHAARH